MSARRGSLQPHPSAQHAGGSGPVPTIVVRRGTQGPYGVLISVDKDTSKCVLAQARDKKDRGRPEEQPSIMLGACNLPVTVVFLQALP